MSTLDESTSMFTGSRGKRTVLLVDDNVDDITLALRALRKAGITNQVHVAHDGVEALDYLFNIESEDNQQTQMAWPAVILLDLKMPRLNGLEVLKRVRQDKRTSLIPVVMLSTSDVEQDIINSYTLGANSYIRKSVNISTFTESMRLFGSYWLDINELPPLGDVN
ncbi:MAG: response regulator [bacterium]